MIGVTARRDDLAMGESCRRERRLNQPALLPMLIVGPRARYWITQRANDFAIGNVQFDALASFRRIEVSRRDLHHRKTERAMAEMPAIPIQAEIIVPDE